MEDKKPVKMEMEIEDFFQECNRRVKSGYYIASLTDEFLVGYWEAVEDVPISGTGRVPVQLRAAGFRTESGKDALRILENGGKVLEIRVFNENRELKLVRSDIAKPFAVRCIDDAPFGPSKSYDRNYSDYYDEWQILDIDETKGRDAQECVTATGGGKYFLPLASLPNACVRIRHYLGKYGETGQARVEDWRVVGFGQV